MRGVRTSALALVLAVGTLVVAHAQTSAGVQAAPCSDPMAVLKAFLDSNDAGRFEASMKYVADDIAFVTWATGVNGYIMAKRSLKGKKELRGYLPKARGLRWRLPESPPDGPIYRETRVAVNGSIVQFMLEPDRKRPNGKQYNPFSIEAVLDGCRIKSLTVIERVTWL